MKALGFFIKKRRIISLSGLEVLFTNTTFADQIRREGNFLTDWNNQHPE